MPDWLLLILATLACYRLANLVTQDEIASPLRNYLGLHRWAWVRGWPAYLVHCPYCLGVWIAAALTLLMWPATFYSLVYWLAIAGGQMFLQRVSYAEG